MEKFDIINLLIEKNGYESYLEIGLNVPDYNYNKINCKNKESVDPYNGNTDNGDNVPEELTYHMTSDDMFKMFEGTDKKWDIILVDGLHEEIQVGRDIINSFKHLSDNGCVVVHDCLPASYEAQLFPRPINTYTLEWNGDVWKSVYEISKMPGFDVTIIAADYGVGIITFNGDKSKLVYPEKSDEEYVESEHLYDLFNVIDVDTFSKRYVNIGKYTLVHPSGVRTFTKYDDKDKYIVFTCAKNENKYISEYVEHYLKLGFDKIVIANNDDDQSILNNTLKKYICLGQVQIFNVQHMRNFQIEICNMFMNESNYAWCAYFDADEYLELTCKYSNIKNFLNTIDTDTVSFNWILYGANDNYSAQNKSLTEQFTKPLYPLTSIKDNMFVKTIVRGIKRKYDANNTHRPEFESDNFKYNLGGEEKVNTLSMTTWPLRYKNGYIKHYYTRSYEEYMEKINRGWPDGNNPDKLKNIYHFVMLNDNSDIKKTRYMNCLFNNQVNVTEHEVIDVYDVIYVFTSNNNYYALYSAVSKLFCEKTGITIAVPTDIDNGLFTELLGIALMTGNKLITCENETNALWNVFLNNTHNGAETYYIYNVF